MDVKNMQQKCIALQWSLDDIDWNAPGAELVTPDQAANLKEFMSDTVWIEYIAALIFQGMADYEKDPVLKSIFASFAVDEMRHSEAELRLMVRWGLIKKR